jgi:o-succinylbenzoate---CoA ligase
MYKDIVFLDGVDEDYLQSVVNFVEEWESYLPVLRISTSGSTGEPKTFEFKRKQVEASARYTGRFFDFKKGDSILLSLSPNFVAGKLMLVRALLHKMKIVVAPLNANPLQEIEKFPTSIKLAAFVPYQVNEILRKEQSKIIYQTIENVIIGGAEIPRELEMKICSLTNKNYATFAMTETLTHFAMRRIDGRTDFYTCLPGIKINRDKQGCLVVEPNEILTTRLTTNDMIELVDDTKFSWVGRIDNVINSGAVKIFPETNEKLIQHLFKDVRFYLGSKKNAALGEEVVLMIEDVLWTEKRREDILIEIEKLLPKYHHPKSILFFDKFEETKNGKIIRKKFL